jgi:glycosyltransferase involved in cell wall biosynthesis
LYGYELLSRHNDIDKAQFLQNFDPYIFGKTQAVDQAYNSMDKILLYSSDLQKIVKHYYGDKRFVKCNNGVDYKRLAENGNLDILNLLGGKRHLDDKSVCFCVAYYRPYKGIKLANEVFGRLKKKGYRTIEICSVNGPLENTMEFFRNPSFEIKCNQISHAGIMLHPSVFETWNLVSMESMALGTPVVGTNSKGIMEYANEWNSVIIDNRDPDLLVEHIEAVYEDEELYNMLVENGIETAQRHDWEVITEEIEESYKKLIQ